MQQQRNYYTALEVAQIIGVRESTGYKIIRQLNAELKEKGYITISGKVSKKFFQEKYYGGVEV